MGNPASHSARAGVCFSREGRQRTHRFWTTLAESGFLTLNNLAELEALDAPVRHARISAQLLNAEYDSPFRIGILPILSMPSTASAPPWSGVGGLYRLFGKPAMMAIFREEERRVHQWVHSFLMERGVIVAFQKDAYETVRDRESPTYSFDAARASDLTARYAAAPSIRLLAGPPTRFWTGRAVRRGLAELRESIEKIYAAELPAKGPRLS
jgi:hypothetical protein